MSIYSTGNVTVDSVAQINFLGKIIPQSWYKNIVNTNGKPNARAMLILSDIFYWCRPTEIRDENTANTVGRERK